MTEGLCMSLVNAQSETILVTDDVLGVDLAACPGDDIRAMNVDGARTSMTHRHGPNHTATDPIHAPSITSLAAVSQKATLT